MIVKEAENICVICGAQIPEGKQVCPMCGNNEKTKSEEKEFKIDDVSEQAFRSGYNTGFADGMKHSCELKLENEKLRRHNAILMAAIERRARNDDMDGEYE